VRNLRLSEVKEKGYPDSREKEKSLKKGQRKDDYIKKKSFFWWGGGGGGGGGGGRYSGKNQRSLKKT